MPYKETSLIPAVVECSYCGLIHNRHTCPGCNWDEKDSQQLDHTTEDQVEEPGLSYQALDNFNQMNRGAY